MTLGGMWPGRSRDRNGGRRGRALQFEGACHQHAAISILYQHYQHCQHLHPSFLPSTKPSRPPTLSPVHPYPTLIHPTLPYLVLSDPRSAGHDASAAPCAVRRNGYLRCRHRLPSDAPGIIISHHQSASVIISPHQSSSAIISHHQPSSAIISYHQSSPTADASGGYVPTPFHPLMLRPTLNRPHLNPHNAMPHHSTSSCPTLSLPAPPRPPTRPAPPHPTPPHPTPFPRRRNRSRGY